MIYYIDIDNTICTLPEGKILDYSTAVPIKKNIRKMNKLYKQGNEVHYWTSRGTLTGIDWLPVTMQQFEDWGVLYSSIQKKPVYDVYIGDKCINIQDFMNG